MIKLIIPDTEITAAEQKILDDSNRSLIKDGFAHAELLGDDKEESCFGVSFVGNYEALNQIVRILKRLYAQESTIELYINDKIFCTKIAGILRLKALHVKFLRIQKAAKTRVIELKTDPLVFAADYEGTKTHQIRLNDRDYRVGDILKLRETQYSQQQMINADAPLLFTGRALLRIVAHIQTGYGLYPDWVILSTK